MADGGEHIVEVLNPPIGNGSWQPIVGDSTLLLRDYLVEERILPNLESAKRVINEACRTLSQCAQPTGTEVARTGLVCGYVQSGKTASMTAVSALAKDNGYRIIVLIAGVTTNLVSQNRDRLETHLRAASPEWAWLMLTNPRPGRNAPELQALLQEWRSEHYEDADRRTLCISVMKNHSHLRNLANLLVRFDLTNIPAIVFDDEADQASLNTRPTDPVASATYRQITDLRAALPHHTYLQYTATPQAPLLITRIDSLSADFAELLSPGERYTGGHEFFDPPNSRVDIIPQNEIYQDGNLPVEPPESLISAMQVFFIGVAAGRLRPTRTHRSMLIHPSKATATHGHYYNWANALKVAWHRVLLDVNEPDRDELIQEFRRAHGDIARTCQDLVPFDQILTRLPLAINQTTVTLVNSVDGREVPWQNGYSHILVGGGKIGEGLYR
jgi:Z1 domain